MGDFEYFLNGFAKSPRLIVLNIDWVQFVSKNCETPHSVQGLYDTWYCFSSDVMYIKYKRLVYIQLDLLASKPVERKNIRPDLFSKNLFSRPNLLWSRAIMALECDIEDVCYFLGVRTCIRLSTACKMFHSKITSLSLKSHMNVFLR